MEAILGVIVGFVAFGVIWFFLLRQKNNQIPTDELKLKGYPIARRTVTKYREELKFPSARQRRQITN